MSIKTEYRGYTITYSENSDEWWSHEVGVSNVSLAKVKAKIDAMHLKLRKGSAVECLYIGKNYGAAGSTPASLIEYVEPKYSSGRWPEEKKVLLGHTVYAMQKEDAKERPTRQKKDLDNYAPDTPEVREAIAAWVVAEEEENAARKRTAAAREAIPRMTVDMIQPLVAASSAKIEEEL